MLNHNISSDTAPLYRSYACGIEDNEDSSFIITGGWVPDGATNRVTKYTRTGQFTDLPTLNTARHNHGCGSYRNSNNQKVFIKVVVMNYCNFIIVKLLGPGLDPDWPIGLT